MKFGSLVLKILLAPLSLIYWIISGFHHLSYSKGWKKSVQFNLPIINIGNLNTGGTGKTPHVALINDILSNNHATAILSRGYGRRSRGFMEVQLKDTSEQVGDEPLLLKHKSPHTPVVVGEERILAVPQLLDLYPETEVILLDDAFQHRRIRANYNILLTCFDDLYIHDFPLPSGRLREPKIGARRADIIIVTKTPHDLSSKQIKSLRRTLKLENKQELFFSQIQYGTPYSLKHPEIKKDLFAFNQIHLVCGIAGPEYIVQYLKQQNLTFDSTFLRDHAPFSDSLLQKLEEKILTDHNVDLLVTEKDAVRLYNLSQKYPALSERIFVLPINIAIGPDEEAFKNTIRHWVQK